MFMNQVYPYLQQRNNQFFHSAMIKISGTGESAAEMMILDLISAQSNPTIATYAKSAEVHIRVTGCGNTPDDAKKITEPVVEEICSRFGKEVFSLEEKEELEDSIVALLKKHRKSVSFAESCTGGLLSGRFVNASGASEVFKSGYITYSNEEKERILNVSNQTLAEFGAVSEETAKEMALGCAQASKTDFSVSVTGIAGPNGGTPQKPVGLVYIGCCYKGDCDVIKLSLSGNRNKIREVAVARALRFLREMILKYLE